MNKFLFFLHIAKKIVQFSSHVFGVARLIYTERQILSDRVHQTMKATRSKGHGLGFFFYNVLVVNYFKLFEVYLVIHVVEFWKVEELLEWVFEKGSLFIHPRCYSLSIYSTVELSPVKLELLISRLKGLSSVTDRLRYAVLSLHYAFFGGGGGLGGGGRSV